MAKKSKRLISILLSVVMVISSIPFVAISAFAEDNTAKDNLSSAIEQFAQKMDGTFYTNMSEAYRAYVTANQTLDIYEATGYDTGMQAAANALNSAMNSMGTFTSKQGTALGSMSKDDTYTTEAYYKQIYQNLLYSPQTTSAVGEHKVQWESSWTGSNGATFRIYYPTTVMLYDGKTDPTMAILGEVQNYYTGTWSRNTRDYAMNMTSSTANGLVFARADGWVGYDNRKDNNRGPNFMWTYFVNSNILPYSPTGTQYYTHDGDSSTSWTNILKYTGDFAAGSYSKTITPTFTYIGGNKNSAKITATVTGNNTPIYVINYKALVDAAKSNKEKIILKGAKESYKHGGLNSVLNAYETAMSVDPTSYNYSSNPGNAVNNCADAIKSAVNGLNNAKTTADGKGYDKLIQALKDSRNDYNAGIADPDIANVYAEGAWDDFKNAYEDAGRIFENLKTTSYDKDEQAGKLADDLNHYRENLVALDRVDATALIIAINNAEAVIAANKYFTAESYAATNAVALVNAAKTAVWGSVDNYGVSAKQLGDTEEARATVKTQADTIRAALMKLKINKDAVVVASGQSYNSAVIEANKYLAHAEDYSNASKLQEALDDASIYANDEDLYLDASIEGHAHYVIETYASGVNAIMFAIQSLNPSFSKITDGTFATMGEKITTTIDSSRYPGYFMLDFSRYTGTIIFKTDHLDKDYDLPDAQFAWKTNRNFDQLLDSININADSELQSGEIISISSSQAITDNAHGWAMNGEQTKTYTGLLAMSNGGLELSFHDIKCSGYKGAHGQIGYDADRNSIGLDRMDYVWDDLLTTTEGTEPFSGGITCKSESNSGYGSTTLNAKMTIKTKATSSKLFVTDKATGEVVDLADTANVKLTKFDTSNSSSYIGMTYSWSHHPFNYWHGYSYDREQYVQQIYVVDISSLLDLISYVEKLDPTQYSNNSWANLTNALIAAKDEMPYAGMTADEIYAACDTRLQNLFEAMMALETPANNLKIKEILDQTTSVYRNDESKCEATTWAAFTKAYGDLYQDFMGKYSDKNVRDYGVSEQDIVDAAADGLIEAYANLVRYADFQVIKNAITILRNSVQDKKFTATQLNALVTAINNYSDSDWFVFYMQNKDAVDAIIDEREANDAILAQMHTFYDSKNSAFADSQADILAVANGINSLIDTLEEDTVDTSVLQAQIENIYASYTDPDAWHGIEEAVAAIENMNMFTDYDLLGRNVKVYAYETEDEIDFAVKQLLEGDSAITPQAYEVKLVDANGTVATATYNYGTKVYVTADGVISDEPADSTGAKADWYYSYKSNTAENGEKFISTDTFLAFVLKGNTTIRMQSATNADKVRVNYVNGLNGKSFKIDYVDAGTSVALDKAPELYNYTFANYTVNNVVVEKNVVVNEDTVIVANYDYTKDTYSVILANMAASLAVGVPFTVSNLKYNDVITVDPSQINKIDSKDTSKVSYTVNGENFDMGYNKRGTTAALKLTYWVAVDPECVDEWLAYLNNTATYKQFSAVINADSSLDVPQLTGSLRLIGVGDKLNYRVHENAMIIALAKQDYDAIVAKQNVTTYISNRDKRNATVYSRGDVVMNSDSFSIISDYSLPAGAEMIETGILFQSNGNATETSTPLTFANVGKALNGDTKAVARMKSTQHTAGNQYVITIGSSKLKGVGAVSMRYAAYIIYEIDGVQYEYIQSPSVSAVANF